MTGPLAVTVLLGTRLEQLRTHGTRWRHVLTRWAADDRVGRLTVVDFPRFGLPPAATATPTWLAGTTALAVTVPGRRRGTVLDRLGWQVSGAQVARRLGHQDLVVAATPLWAPLLPHLHAVRRGFDAVDDWRALGSMSALRRRVDAGYRAAARCDSATAVSPALAERLHADHGIDAEVVPNGVDLAAFRSPGPPPEGLPDGPFAVYVGVVEGRVDLALLAAAAEVVPVVVAGPADERPDLPGTTWLGPVDVADVPGLLRRAAVGLVPHVRDALTTSMDPMKVLEYLAAGLPVVSTPVPTSAPTDRVLRADGPAAFADAVRAALRLGRDEVPALGDRDWDSVADRLLVTHAGGGS